MVEILVLGAVEATVEGEPRPIGGAKQRALLARLLVSEGKALTPAQLCEDLWNTEPPRNPAHALQARISRLRATLPLDIEFVNGGYRLDPSAVPSDAGQFTYLQEQAAAHLAADELAQAGECLHSALSLWRGPAFADVPDIPGLRAESARLEHHWGRAIADRIDVDLALGHDASLVSELSSLVEEYPSRERHWGQLMLAQYAAGHVQDSLKTFEQARTAFTEASGAAPGKALRELHVAILREQPAERLLRIPGGVREQYSAPSETHVRHSPATDAKAPRLSSNRHTDLIARLEKSRAVLITGPPGIGKSHVLRSVRSDLLRRGHTVPLLAGSTLGLKVPLGVFAGAVLQPESAQEGRLDSASSLINYFARHRSNITILVDDVNLIDESSLFVIMQLIRSTHINVILSTRNLTSAPPEIQALYDSGELTEAPITALSDAEAHDLATRLVDGQFAPETGARILAAAEGNPLHLREIVEGSRSDSRLVGTDHGWELRGDPTPTARLVQVAGERFAGLKGATIEAAMRVAIAGELAPEALNDTDRAALSRTDLITITDSGWLRLARPLDREVLRHRSSEMLWIELTRDVVRLLRSPVAAGRPQAHLRADLLALDLSDPIDIPATLVLAERALAAFDERLALRAAHAIVTQDPAHAEAHRVLGLAASALGQLELADNHFSLAGEHATSDADRTAIARAHAQHRGLRLHDAAGALHIIEDALGSVTGEDSRAHLERAQMRWATIAGMGSPPVSAPTLTADAADALSLITVGMSGVLTGPLAEAVRSLTQLREVPSDIIDRIPGGQTLIELTAVMALSYSGDVVATQRRLRSRIAEAESEAPETVGTWEYAQGFIELFSGDAERAYEIACSAVKHLRWRDASGLISAARALAAAAARATGRAEESEQGFAAISESAVGDPKVVMLRAWADAWNDHAAGHSADAAHKLLDAARWLLTAQHTFFAGMLAHCAMRTAHLDAEAQALIESTVEIGGGGLLELFSRHAEARRTDDAFGLDVVARHARELGLASTASDTWSALSGVSGDSALVKVRREAMDQLRAQCPDMVTWAR
ncbi:MAG: BTAD domain-containing putative transcriptional regulator [Leucobacter sp.]